MCYFYPFFIGGYKRKKERKKEGRHIYETYLRNFPLLFMCLKIIENNNRCQWLSFGKCFTHKQQV